MNLAVRISVTKVILFAWFLIVLPPLGYMHQLYLSNDEIRWEPNINYNFMIIWYLTNFSTYNTLLSGLINIVIVTKRKWKRLRVHILVPYSGHSKSPNIGRRSPMMWNHLLHNGQLEIQSLNCCEAFTLACPTPSIRTIYCFWHTLETPVQEYAIEAL